MEEITPTPDNGLPMNEEELREFTKRTGGRPKKEDQVSPQLRAVICSMFRMGAKPTRIMEELKVSKEKVANALRDIKRVSVADLETHRLDYASEISNIVRRLLTAANDGEFPEKIATTTHNSTFATTLGVLLDKFNVLTGNPTNILETQSRVKQNRETMAEIQKQLSEMKALRTSLNGNTNPQTN